VIEMQRLILHYSFPVDVLLSRAIFAANCDEKDHCFLL
jgi:hypothetical protein